LEIKIKMNNIYKAKAKVYCENCSYKNEEFSAEVGVEIENCLCPNCQTRKLKKASERARIIPMSQNNK